MENTFTHSIIMNEFFTPFYLNLALFVFIIVSQIMPYGNTTLSINEERNCPFD